MRGAWLKRHIQNSAARRTASLGQSLYLGVGPIRGAVAPLPTITPSRTTMAPTGGRGLVRPSTLRARAIACCIASLSFITSCSLNRWSVPWAESEAGKAGKGRMRRKRKSDWELFVTPCRKKHSITQESCPAWGACSRTEPVACLLPSGLYRRPWNFPRSCCS